MAVRAKVTMNQTALRQLAGAQAKALVLTAEAVKTEVMTAAVVPKQTGELERSGHVNDAQAKQGRVKLVFDTPYARRLYWHPEYDFRTDKNRSAQGRWLDAWVIGNKKSFAPKAFREIYRRICRGLIK